MANQSRTWLNRIPIEVKTGSSERMPPEDVDIYMKTSEGDVVHFYQPQTTGRYDHNRQIRRLAELVDRLDAERGEETVYEYRDGRRVRVLRAKAK